jgi:hypothetical protein
MLAVVASHLLVLPLALLSWALIPAGHARAQVPPAEPPRVGGLELRLLDAEGRVLAEGAKVEVGIAWGALYQPDHFPSLGFNREPFEVLAVEGGGRLSFQGIRSAADDSRYRRAELLVIARDAEGRRSRARCAWPVDAAVERPLELRVLPEQELFRVRLIDSLGALVHANEVSLFATSPDSTHSGHLIYRAAVPRDAPCVERGSGNELGIWGWPVEGIWGFSASYIYHGPTSAPAIGASGTREIELVLPATGHAQVKLKLPRPFPNDALKAVYRHVGSGAVASRMILDGASNHRLLVGKHALHLELCGKKLLDLGLIDVPHGGTQELAVALPPTLRTFRLLVQDEQGRELPEARARLERASGSPVPRGEGRTPLGVLVATDEPKLDFLVECEGFEPQRVIGVEGERVVRLRRRSRGRSGARIARPRTQQRVLTPIGARGGARKRSLALGAVA